MSAIHERYSHYIKIMQQKRLIIQDELERLNKDPKKKKLMKDLQDLLNERKRTNENIKQHLNMMAAYRHFIHKVVHSSKDISGLPVSHDCAQDVKTMFTDGIAFLNNIGETSKALNNTEENNVDSLKLTEAVTTCTEAVGSELYQTRCSIAQLDTLKDNIALLQEHISESSVNNSDENTMNDTYCETDSNGSTNK